MRLLYCLSIIALFNLISCEEIESGQLSEKCGRFINNRYFLGNKTEFDDYPWTALLVYDTPKGKALGCGGVLLSKRYVLTAAHCVTRLGGNWSLASVRLAEYNTETDIDCLPDNDHETFCAPPPKNYAVEEVIAHEEYAAGSRAHDIALVRFNESVSKFSDYVWPICLPTKPSIIQKFHVAGWGKLAGRKGSVEKLRSSLSAYNTSQCVEAYANQGVKLAEDQICAGNWTKDSNGAAQEPCIGDSGSALMGIEKAADYHRMTVFGLLTMDSKFCGVNDWPGIYVDVFRYKDWILQRANKE